MTSCIWQLLFILRMAMCVLDNCKCILMCNNLVNRVRLTFDYLTYSVALDVVFTIWANSNLVLGIYNVKYMWCILFESHTAHNAFVILEPSSLVSTVISIEVCNQFCFFHLLCNNLCYELCVLCMYHTEHAFAWMSCLYYINNLNNR